jgi:hypothetical protein
MMVEDHKIAVAKKHFGFCRINGFASFYEDLESKFRRWIYKSRMIN